MEKAIPRRWSSICWTLQLKMPGNGCCELYNSFISTVKLKIILNLYITVNCFAENFCKLLYLKGSNEMREFHLHWIMLTFKCWHVMKLWVQGVMWTFRVEMVDESLVRSNLKGVSSQWPIGTGVDRCKLSYQKNVRCRWNHQRMIAVVAFSTGSNQISIHILQVWVSPLSTIQKDDSCILFWVTQPAVFQNIYWWSTGQFIMWSLLYYDYIILYI